MSFKDDIQGSSTSLFPVVTIEPPNTEGIHPNTTMGECIFLSTNSVSLDHIHSSTVDDEEYYNIYFKPLLLNIPSIKESIFLLDLSSTTKLFK